MQRSLSFLTYLFLTATALAATKGMEWEQFNPETLKSIEGYEWRVWEEAVHAHANKVSKQKNDIPPTFSVDFSDMFRSKSILELMPPKFYALTNGWLVYVNGGEFGGGLKWYSSDGDQSYEIAKDLRVLGIIESNDDLIVYGGLSHLGSSHGFIYKLSLNNRGEWALGEGVSLPTPVLLLHSSDNNLKWKQNDGVIWVIGSRIIAQYNKHTNRLKYLYGQIGYSDQSRSLWRYKSPNSIAKDYATNAIFIGTSVGVLRIQAGSETWVRPKEQQSTQSKRD